MQLDNPPTTVSPEDYFRYYCKDPKAVEMFYKFSEDYESNLEDKIKNLREEVDDLENELAWGESVNSELNSEIDRLKQRIEDLEWKESEEHD